MNRLFLIIGVLTLMAKTECNAQEYAHPVRKFSRESGLGYEYREMVEDGEGYVWLMYRDRVERFDGENLDQWFCGKRPLSLHVDSRGEVWLALTEGIYRFDREIQDFTSVKTGSASEKPSVFFSSADFHPGLLSEDGLSSYDVSKRHFSESHGNEYRPRRGAKTNESLIDGNSNTLFYATTDTVWQHNLSDGRLNFHPVYSPRRIIALSEDEAIVVNWESKSWYYNFRDKTEIRLTVAAEDPGLLVYDAIPATVGGFLMATSKGLKRYEAATKTLNNVPLSYQGRILPKEQFRQLFRGKEGRIWACTENSLLYFYDDQSTIYHLKGNEGSSSSNYSGDVRYFAEDNDGMLWLATVDGLTGWDRTKNEFNTIRAVQNAEDRLNHPSIRGLVFDGENLIIGQTNHGIWIFNPESESFKRPVFERSRQGETLRAKLEQDFINQIYTLPSGDHVVSARDGAYLLSKKSYFIKEIEFPGKDEIVKFSYGTEEGKVFMGTLKGLYQFSSDLKFEHKIEFEGFDQCSNWTMLHLDDHYLIGTGEGVFRLKLDEAVAKHIVPELSGTRIFTIFADSMDGLWYVTDDMVYQQTPQAKHLLKYGFAENVRGDSFFANCYHTDKSGQVYLGGANGINIFHPEKLRHHSELPPPYIRSAYLPESNDSLALKEAPLELKHFENALELTFSVPYFGNRKDLNYSYRLSDDAPWSEQGNNPKLSLWNLSPGNYKLTSAVALNNGERHISGSTLQFRIIPPFWKQPWFYALIVFIVSLSIYAYVESIKSKLRLEKKLNQFATSLYGMSTVDGILNLTAQQVVEKFNFVNCAIYSLEKESQYVRRAQAGKIHLRSTIANTSANENLTSEPNLSKRGAIEDKAGTAYHNQPSPNLNMPGVTIHAVGKPFGLLLSEENSTYFLKRKKIKVLNKISKICSERLTVYLTEEKVRAGIARDLHDEMGSTLTSISILSKIGTQKTRSESTSDTSLHKIFGYSQALMEKMSDLVWVINPGNDSLSELISHLREYGSDLADKIEVDIHIKDNKVKTMKLDAERRKNLFLILKESVNNAAKHSDSPKVKVDFQRVDSNLVVKISDSGVGFDSNVARSGNGLKNIRERAGQIGAELEIESAPGKGVSIELTIPWTYEKH